MPSINRATTQTPQTHSDKASPIVGLLTETEAAEYLAVSTRTLQSWRVRGGGPAFVQLGSRRAVRYERQALQDFVARSRRTSTSDTAGARDGGEG